MSKVLVNDSTLIDIADAIRLKNNSTDTYLPSEMATAILKRWVRPEEWPDLDALDLTDSDVMYYTLDCTDAITQTESDSTYQYPFSITATLTAGTWQLDRGYIDSDGFHVIENIGIAESKTALTDYLPVDEGNYVVYRATSIDGYFKSIYPSTIDDIYMFTMPVVEVVGRLPYCTSINNLITVKTIACHVILPNTTTITDLSSTFQQMVSLKSLDMSDWDTSNWTIKSLVRTFQNCVSLESLDLSSWNTSNWAVTSLSNMFQNCVSLQEINLSGWDTSNWAVTTMQYMFQYCASLKSLDLSGWDTSNWAVTTIQYMFQYCVSLEEIDLSGWDTSNWAVTTLQYTFTVCSSLKSVDLSGWDTSNWPVTTMQYIFQNCKSIEYINMSGWDTSKWSISTLSSIVQNCTALESVDLSGWNTSNWAVTSLSNMFQNCIALKSVDLSGWDTSNWAVTTIQYMFQYCTSLKSINLSGWDTSNWSLTSNCTIFVQNDYSLTDFTPPSEWFAVNTTLSESSLLTVDSLNSLIAALPETTSTLTLTIGSINLAKLTDEEIAVATDKGWAVA